MHLVVSSSMRRMPPTSGDADLSRCAGTMLNSMTRNVELHVRCPVQDRELSDLHARAFGNAPSEVTPWARRLHNHSLSWVGAFRDATLIGFVHACWDGGRHAFLLDTVVDPAHRRTGVGRALVQTLVAEVTAAGCEWLHVDYEPHLSNFYIQACGFRSAEAGLLRLAAPC